MGGGADEAQARRECRSYTYVNDDASLCARLAARRSGTCAADASGTNKQHLNRRPRNLHSHHLEALAIYISNGGDDAMSTVARQLAVPESAVRS